MLIKSEDIKMGLTQLDSLWNEILACILFTQWEALNLSEMLINQERAEASLFMPSLSSFWEWGRSSSLLFAFIQLDSHLIGDGEGLLTVSEIQTITIVAGSMEACRQRWCWRNGWESYNSQATENGLRHWAVFWA